MHPVVGPVGGDERLAQVLQGGVAGVFDLLLEQYDPVRVSTLLPVDGADAAALGAHSDLRLLVHLDLGDQVAGRRVPAREVDAGGFAHQAASPIAPDEILGSECRFVGQLDIDAGAVLGEAHHLSSTVDRHSELFDPAGQDGLDPALPQRQNVVVAGGEVADVQEGPGIAHERMLLALREEAFGNATLIEHLDGAGVKTASARTVDLLTGASFDDDDVDPRQRQLARQHEPGRAASCDDHHMLAHSRTPSIPPLITVVRSVDRLNESSPPGLMNARHKLLRRR